MRVVADGFSFMPGVELCEQRAADALDSGLSGCVARVGGVEEQGNGTHGVDSTTSWRTAKGSSSVVPAGATMAHSTVCVTRGTNGTSICQGGGPDNVATVSVPP